jgi:6-phospho-beta-glucosidase
MAALRLVILGGSGASTPELVDALAGWPGGPDRRPPLELVLQGRSAEKLALVAEACRSRLPGAGPEVAVSTETDLARALDGADIVLVQVRVGGLAARAFDETFPHAFGLPGEETMGPGGFANALRTVPALVDIWEHIATHAPGAFIVNLTNPSGIVSGVATAHTGLRFHSICDGPVTFVEGIARATGREPAVVRARYAGLNHCGFWVDPDPDVLVAALSASSGLDDQDVRALGALPSPYVRYYLHPERQLQAQLSAGESRAQVLRRLETEMLDQYARNVVAEEQTRRGALWYRVSIVPLVDAVVHGGQESIVLGLPNAGAVAWAPDDAMVELPTDVRAGGATQRLSAPELPPTVIRLLSAHARFETLTARALADVRSRDDLRSRRPGLVEALLANPLVDDATLAERLVDEILAASPA